MMMNTNWRGIYDLESSYSVGDLVYHVDDGFTYICIRDTFGIPPYINDSGFELFAGFTVIDAGDF
jgi:hypothetical protein